MTPTGLTVGSPISGTPLIQAWTYSIPLRDENGNIVRDEHGNVVYSDAPSLVVSSPLSIAVSSPAIGKPALNQSAKQAASSIAVSSPAIGKPAINQLDFLSASGITVASPVRGVPGAKVTSVLATAGLAASPLSVSSPGLVTSFSGLELFDLNGNTWSFGSINPNNPNEAQVLRNGANPYGTLLYASVLQIGPAQFSYNFASDGSHLTANWAGWCRTASGQWYFDNGGTAMVPWPAPPNFPMLEVGIATARPNIGASLLDSATFALWLTYVNGTYARATPATYLQSGIVKTAAVNEPRFPTDINGKPQGLRLSGAATNVLLNSSSLTSASWLATNAAVSSGYFDPSGGSSASLVAPLANGISAVSYAAYIGYNATQWTLSVFCKNAGFNFLAIDVNDWGQQQASIDLTTGAVRTFGPNITAGSTQLANGWWLFNLTVVAAHDGNPDFIVQNTGVLPIGGVTANANGALGVYLWGAQVTNTVGPVDYIPTTTAAATQAADVLTPAAPSGPILFLHNAFGITVGRPVIGVPVDPSAPPPFMTYVSLTAVDIETAPNTVIIAWPAINEVVAFVAIDLVPWIPDIGETPLAVALAGNAIGTTDKINPYIDRFAGETLLYRAASGLEKAMADVDGFRLMATYAELVKEQWDPYAISSQNLPFLAYAQGVNLWEADWDDTFRRWWVANQWELKSQRGSLLGTERFVAANAPQRVAHAIVPPAKFMPGKSYTDAERAQYNSRFAQLRLYPYYARVQLPWLCYVSNFIIGQAQLDGTITQVRRYTNNGCFLGPIKPFYPTSADAGGRFTSTATIWDRGVETPITFRTVKEVSTAGVVTTWDEVVVPAKIANHYYAGQANKWPLKNGHPIRWNKYGIFLGIMDETASRIVKIPRNGELDVDTAKAIYQTIVPDNTYIDVYPEQVATPHPISARRLYSGAPYKRPKQFLANKFLPTSIAFQFIYEVWYIFDYSRVPDYRKASVYMGQARFGIQRYTAELRIDIPIQWRKWYLYNGGFMRGHMHPPDTRELDKCRRAVTASMAVRDTIRIDTIMKRQVNTNDSLPCDGTFSVGEYIDA